ncbi:hypothetical protein GUJ93_ZPchr0015g6877 [Zizania palustris]|uniref:Uncharacterized protein n=1 Tax=Zizania palustris TaxID=103762 RepID=A0A8J5TGG8_ZIZPA|nr:hypothetical protein GUJ93_ZPchr0015g6877 [Zizania palustris]
MQRRFIIIRGVLRGFGITKIVVFGHFGDSWGGLRTKPVRSLLSPPRYLGLKVGHLSGHVSKAIFISSGRTFRVLRTDEIFSPKTKWRGFKDCLGALDDTHIEVLVPLSHQGRFRNRKQKAMDKVKKSGRRYTSWTNEMDEALLTTFVEFYNKVTESSLTIEDHATDEFARTTSDNAKEMNVEDLSNKDPGSNTSISSDVGDDRRKRHRMNDHDIAFLGDKLDSFVAALKDDSSQDPKIVPPEEVVAALKAIADLDGDDDAFLDAYDFLILDDRKFNALLVLPMGHRKK